MASHPFSAASAEACLLAVEQALIQVDEALHHSEPEALQHASVHLRDVASRFAEAFNSETKNAWPPEWAQRVRAVALQLGSQRDALARACAVVDRQVAGVLPAQAPDATYGALSGQRGGVARMYRSAG